VVKPRVSLIYDGSFEGFLSAIFEIYQRRLDVENIYPIDRKIKDLFTTQLEVDTNEEHSIRVLTGIRAKSGVPISKSIYRCFLSEQEGIELKLYLLIKELLKGNIAYFKDFRKEHVNDLHKTLKMIRREVHRMHAFVRFQELKDGTFGAVIEPDFNVIPLIGSHFRERYPAMEWVIFDTKRQYGIHYKEGLIKYVTIEEGLENIDTNSLSEGEVAYQQMWKQYFKSVNISERNNTKLHLRHVPKRYWKNLIEKN
jgi:probable DNA metabolism protein